MCTALLPSLAAAQTLDLLHAFEQPASGVPGKIIQGIDGAFYGVTQGGGAYGRGTVFRINADGSGLTFLHSFNGAEGGPSTGLLQADDGFLYGSTGQAIFKVATDGSGAAVLHDFCPGYYCAGRGARGALIQGSDGALYGTTFYGGSGGNPPSGYGTVFKLNTDGSGYELLHAFASSDGAYPAGSLLEAADGALYGTTWRGGADDGGTIFGLGRDGGRFHTLYSFPAWGFPAKGEPHSTLIQGSDGLLYGTTIGGYGGVYRIRTDGLGLEYVHTFSGADGTGPYAGLMAGSDGTLYGTTVGGSTNNKGTVFRLRPDGAGFATLHEFSGPDGASPFADLTVGTDGALYGAADAEGLGYGTLFRLSTTGTGFRVLWAPSAPGGVGPLGGLVRGSDGAFYGTTERGGVGYGTVFRIGEDGAFSVLHAFDGSDGTWPQAGVIEGSDGAFYGTTRGFPGRGIGTVYRIDGDGNGFAVLHAFDDGQPFAGLLEASDGLLYGTTSGTLFRVGKDGNAFETLRTFAGDPAGSPMAGLIQGLDGALYGTQAGASGAVFRVERDGSGFAQLHAFGGADGRTPKAGLVQHPDGALFGTTESGGDDNLGTVFRLNPDGSGFARLHSFAQGGGAAHPRGELLLGDGQMLFGTTFHSAFSLDAGSATYRDLYHFFEVGVGASGRLVRDAAGRLYGTFVGGGPWGGGAAFRLTPDTEADIGVALAGPADPVPAGAPFEITLTVTNHGPDRASGVLVKDSFWGARFESGPPECQAYQGLVSCLVLALDKDASLPLQLRFTAGAGSSSTQSAQVKADPADVEASNDAATLTTTHSGPSGQLRLDAASYSGPELGAVTITVVRQFGSTGRVTVDYRTIPGTAKPGLDYQARSGRLVFLPGEASHTIRVPLLGDCRYEGSESFGFALSNPTGKALLASPVAATIAVENDDDPGQIEFKDAAYSHSESGFAAVTLVRKPLTGTGPLACGVTVGVASADGAAHSGSDYTRVSRTLAFGAGVDLRSFNVPIVADSQIEPDEQLTLTLGSPTGGAGIGPTAGSVLTIANDDFPGSLAFGSSAYAVDEAGLVTVSVVRTGGLGTGVAVQFRVGEGTASNGVDFTARSGTLSFGAGVTRRSFSVQTFADRISEGDETIDLTLSSPTGGASLAEPATAVLTVRDDDAGP